MQHRFLLSCLLLATTTLASPKPGQCRCRPSDPCWPAQSDWNGLNASIDGNLVAVKPVGLPCHDPDFDSAACQLANSQNHNSTWRGVQPGAVQNPIWEARPSVNESCYLDSARTIPCGQGSVPLFSAEVETAAHIQAAVKFAKSHNLRLAIKSTGHCYLGRSSAPDSLRIATHKMKRMDFVDDFVPQGGHKAAGPAVTVGAGVYLRELYTAAGQRGLTFVGGTARTVGPAGGYIQGGGHSALGSWKGMASDNALQFEVVTAQGGLVVANDHQNKDLFWALRGGGGGTFGVVVSATIRTFPDAPLVLAIMSVSTNNTDGYWKTVRDLQAFVPNISDAGGSGYYTIAPAADPSSPSSILGVYLFVNQSDEATVGAFLGPMVSKFTGYVGKDSLTVNLTSAPATRYFFQALSEGDIDGSVGNNVILGSRLISHDFLASADGPDHLHKAVLDIEAIAPGTELLGHIVAGGQVARNQGLDTALNPAWRRAVVHLVVVAGWGSNATVEEQQVTRDRMTHEQMPLLKALEPGMGAYLNEADAGEEDWQASFWGSSYNKLYKLKQKFDPHGLFMVRRGVGSEDWDDEGICRRC